MLPIQPGQRAVSVPRGSSARATSASGFVVPADIAVADAEAVAAADGPAALAGLLAVQEQSVTGEASGAVADRAARRHGREILGELAALQRGLLAPEAADMGDTLQRLATLVATFPHAHDPTTRSVLAAVALRARIELTRRRTR